MGQEFDRLIPAMGTRFVFWTVILVWLASVALRYLLYGLSGYAGLYTEAFWGSRYFAEHLMVEALIVVVWGVICHSRDLSPVPRSWTTGAIIALVVLPVLHFISGDWEIGHTARGTVAGQTLAIDWTYQPAIETGRVYGDRASVQVKRFEGELIPINRARSAPGLLLRLAMSAERDASSQLIFKESTSDSLCIDETANRYCRFRIGEIWYFASHQTFDEEDMVHVPSLAELRDEVPRLYESFAAN